MHYSVTSNTIKYVGDWSNQGHGLNVFDHEALKADNNTEAETLVVVTKEETPYVMLKEGKTGNAAYDGFAIDLLKVFPLIIEIRTCLVDVAKMQKKTAKLEFAGFNSQLNCNRAKNARQHCYTMIH